MATVDQVVGSAVLSDADASLPETVPPQDTRPAECGLQRDAPAPSAAAAGERDDMCEQLQEEARPA